MSCGRGTVVKWSRHGIVVSSCRCKSWACEVCCRSRRRQLRDAIESGKPTRFLTLTWDASRPETPEEARALMGPAFKLLMGRMRRKLGGRQLEYASIVERTIRGYPHFHIAMRCPWISTRWISQTWATLIDAPVVKIKRVKTIAGLAVYLSKYLSKDPNRIGTGKRYWFSQGYRPDRSEERAAHARRFVYQWRSGSLHEVVAALRNPAFIPLRISDERVVLYAVGEP